MTLGTNIKAFRKMQGATQEYFGEIAEVSGSAVSQWETDTVEPSIRAIEKLAQHYNVPKSVILGDMTHPNLENRTSSTYLPKGAIALTPVKTVAIPVYGYVHAGEMSDADTIEARKQNIPEDIELRNPGCFGLIVEGDCMDKVYPEGCLIVVSPSKIPQNGSIVCFQDEDYRMVMRRYYRGANTLVLSPDSFNSEHVDIVYDDPEGSPIKVLGVVVWWQAAEEME